LAVMMGLHQIDHMSMLMSYSCDRSQVTGIVCRRCCHTGPG
jgi:hypothetical protein